MADDEIELSGDRSLSVVSRDGRAAQPCFEEAKSVGKSSCSTGGAEWRRTRSNDQ
jgi:hypothetical protein